jgi:hypothetical protein
MAGLLQGLAGGSKTWLVSFTDYDLGYIDLEEKTLQPLENRFGPKVLPIWPVRSVTYVCGLDPVLEWRAWRESNPRPSASKA